MSAPAETFSPDLTAHGLEESYLYPESATGPEQIVLPQNSALPTSPFPNADPLYQCSTINTIPTTSALLDQSKLPLALVLSPYCSMKEGEEQVPLPLITDGFISRCSGCGAYMNPSVLFTLNNRWWCRICHTHNDVHSSFGTNYQDKAELNYSVVEYLTLREYIV